MCSSGFSEKQPCFSHCFRTHNFSILSRHLGSVNLIQEKRRNCSSCPEFHEILNRCFNVNSIFNRDFYCLWHILRIFSCVLGSFFKLRRESVYISPGFLPLLQLKGRLHNSLQHMRFQAREKKYKSECHFLAGCIIWPFLFGSNIHQN